MYLGKHFHSCLFPWKSTSITPIVAHENGALGYKKIYSPITISNSLDQVLVQTEKARICPFPRFETKLSSCSNLRVLKCQVDPYSLFLCLLQSWYYFRVNMYPLFKISWLRAVIVPEKGSCKKLMLQVPLYIWSYLSLSAFYVTRLNFVWTFANLNLLKFISLTTRNSIFQTLLFQIFSPLFIPSNWG